MRGFNVRLMAAGGQLSVTRGIRNTKLNNKKRLENVATVMHCNLSSPDIVPVVLGFSYC